MRTEESPYRDVFGDERGAAMNRLKAIFVLIAFAASVAVALVLAPAAQATFPGENGKLAFGSTGDPAAVLAAGEAGGDTQATCFGRAATIVGSGVIVGTAGDDVIVG